MEDAPVIQPKQVVICADCHKPIEGHGKNSAEAIAERTKTTYGVALCYDCAVKRKAPNPQE